MLELGHGQMIQTPVGISLQLLPAACSNAGRVLGLAFHTVCTARLGFQHERQGKLEQDYVLLLISVRPTCFVLSPLPLNLSSPCA